MGTGYFISVFLHIIMAAFWIGGMLFLPLVILPGIKNHPDRVALLYKTGITFRFYGWIALGTLLITGLINAYLRGMPFTWAYFTSSNYGRLVGYKLLLFVAILLVSAVHDFYIGRRAIEDMQNNPDPGMRRIASWSGRLSLLIALTMAWFGLVLSRGGEWPG